MKRFFMVIAVFLVLAPAARADTLGQSISLHVNASYDSAGSSVVPVTIRAVGQNAYFAVDDRAWGALPQYQQQQLLTNLNQLVQDFDTTIYPKATAFWGHEAKPGVDGDPRITVLVESLVSGIGGYFESVNAYPVSQAPESNTREMVTVSFDSVLSGNAESFLAHEFQHLISFNQKELAQNISDDTWLNEARSEYDITVTGFNQPYYGSTLQRRVQTFLRTPSDSLTQWPNTSTDYAIATLFTHYLADRFGPQILQSTIHAHTNGTAAIDEWLVNSGSTERFGEVFADWMVASLINDPAAGAQYAYTTPGLTSLHVAPVQSTSALVTEWQPVWLIAPGPTVTITGQGTTWWGGADVATYADGHHRVVPFSTSNDQAVVTVPSQDGGSSLVGSVIAVTQGLTDPADGRSLLTVPVTITSGASLVAPPTSTPTPIPVSTAIKDGDLIRRIGQQEVYVVWGTYRRYLPQGVLALYGFQNRPVMEVSDSVFNQYTTSNYVRAVDGKKVYALWPDATKHWLNITPAQWDASGRDWNAIFIVNDAEVNFYAAGPDITR